MDAVRFLQDLTVVLSVAAAILLLFKKLKQPPVLGYLAAGLIIGPHFLGASWVTDVRSLEAMAEIGVIFLLFALGVEFHLKRLAKIGIKALACALIEIILMMALGYSIAAALGWPAMDGFILGGIIALASTAIAARTLLDFSRHPTGLSELVAGTLIAEDLAAVGLIAFLSSAAQFGNAQITSLVYALARLGVLLVLILVLGLLILPVILRTVERAKIEEVSTLVIIGVCFGVSLITEKLGFSSALGAFLAGAMTSVSASNLRLYETVAPFKDLFGAVFFVSVGMLIDPQWLITHWQLALGLVVLVVATRFIANFLALTAVGEESVPAIQAALIRLPIGEFSFVLAQLAHRYGISQGPIYPLAVAACLATTLMSCTALPYATGSPEKLQRLVPAFFDKALKKYHRQIKHLKVPFRTRELWKMLRRSVIQILLNVMGISALFLIMGAVHDKHGRSVGVPGAFWIVASLVSLPFLIALLRKTHAATLIIIEAVSTKNAKDIPPLEKHPILTRVIVAAALALVVFWYLALSAKLLAPWPYTALPIILVILVGVLLWRQMNKLYGKIQVALREVLSGEDTQPETSATALAHFLTSLTPEKIRVVCIYFDGHFWAAGKSLGEIALRTKTGASVLQINREDKTIPTPGSDVTLADNDEVLLIGHSDQIKKARTLLESGD